MHAVFGGGFLINFCDGIVEQLVVGRGIQSIKICRVVGDYEKLVIVLVLVMSCAWSFWNALSTFLNSMFRITVSILSSNWSSSLIGGGDVVVWNPLVRLVR